MKERAHREPNLCCVTANDFATESPHNITKLFLGSAFTRQAAQGKNPFKARLTRTWSPVILSVDRKSQSDRPTYISHSKKSPMHIKQWIGWKLISYESFVRSRWPAIQSESSTTDMAQCPANTALHSTKKPDVSYPRTGVKKRCE